MTARPTYDGDFIELALLLQSVWRLVGWEATHLGGSGMEPGRMEIRIVLEKKR